MKQILLILNFSGQTVDTTDPDFTIRIPNTDPAQSKMSQ